MRLKLVNYQKHRGRGVHNLASSHFDMQYLYIIYDSVFGKTENKIQKFVFMLTLDYYFL